MERTNSDWNTKTWEWDKILGTISQVQRNVTEGAVVTFTNSRMIATQRNIF